MKRRDFITLFGGAAAWPLVANAQTGARLPVVGILIAGTPATHGPWFAALVQRLRDLGWVEGRNIEFEYRSADNRDDRYSEIATEFVRLKVDVIVTTAPAVPAIKQQTSVIPIVFALATEPVGSGLVASLARPGGNATGLSLQSTDVAGKRLELLRETFPGLRELAVMANADSPSFALEATAVLSAAQKLGIEPVLLEIRKSEDIASAFAKFNGRVQGLYVGFDPLMNANRVHINTLARSNRWPTVSAFREFVEAGGLMSYAPNNFSLFRRAGDYVDKILRGTKPSEIPVEQPTAFDLIINLTTAKALGLTVPPMLLALADEVIE